MKRWALFKKRVIKRLFKTDVLSLVLSCLALFVAYLSYQNEKRRELAEKSPAIILNVDSDRITFSLDKENARLQTVLVKLPDALTKEIYISEGKELEVKVSDIEKTVTGFFSKRIQPKARGMDIKIPVVIDYETVIDRRSVLFREDHFLVFKVCSILEDDSLGFVYSHNRFNYGLTCPQQYDRQESEKLKTYLDNRFFDSMQYFAYSGLIK